MPWNMTAVKSSADVKLTLDDIDADARTAVDEAAVFFAEPANVGQRLIIPFDSTDDRDQARVHIRSYCEARPAGRLTASIWAGFTGTVGEGDDAVTRWSSADKSTDVCKTPALSVTVKPYVKRERTDTASPDATQGESEPEGSGTTE